MIDRPSRLEGIGFFLGANWPLTLPILAFVGMFRAWRRRGKDPDLGSIEPRYAPPEGLTPAEVGVVADNSADMRDITATLVDLAVRGYLLIEEKEEKKLLGLISGKEYVFTLRRDRQAWDELRAHENALMRAVFEAGESVELSDLRNKFYKHLPDLRDGLMDSLVNRQVDRIVPSVRGRRRRGDRGARLDTRRPAGSRTSRRHDRRGAHRPGHRRIRAHHAGSHARGCADLPDGPGLRGVPLQSGVRSLQADDNRTRDVRGIPAVRDGPGGRREVGLGVRGSLPRAP